MTSLVLEIGFSCIQFLSAPGVYDFSALAGVAFPWYPQGRHPRFTFSKLNTLPADAPCPLMPGAYASTAASRPPPQDSRSGGSLLLSCRTLSFPTTCRFIPALGYPAMAPLAGSETRDGGRISAQRSRQRSDSTIVIAKPYHPGESVGEKLSSNVESMTYGQFDVAKSL